MATDAEIAAKERQKLLGKAKNWFREKIIPNHIRNTEKLANPREFDINPLLVPYIATFLTGELTARSVAQALIYPRVLGTSITTSFGTNMQNFIVDVLHESYGSMVQGIDLEFIDAMDGRRKYCQAKLGVNTVNKDDVITIHNHFRTARNLGKTNNADVQQHDLVVGIFSGEPGQESNHYKQLRDIYDHPLYIGRDFWHRMTGDENFYSELIAAIVEVAIEANGKDLVEKTIEGLARADTIKRLAGEA